MSTVGSPVVYNNLHNMLRRLTRTAGIVALPGQPETGTLDFLNNL